MAFADKVSDPTEPSSSPTMPIFLSADKATATASSSTTTTALADVDTTKADAVAAVAAAAAAAATALRTGKRLRSPSPSPRRPSPTPTNGDVAVVSDAAGDAADPTSDEGLSPRKLARLASGSRFDRIAEPQGGGGGAGDAPAEAVAVGDGSDYDQRAVQTALSVLRSAEALISQRVAVAAAEASKDSEATAASALGSDGAAADTSNNVEMVVAMPAVGEVVVSSAAAEAPEATQPLPTAVPSEASLAEPQDLQSSSAAPVSAAAPAPPDAAATTTAATPAATIAHANSQLSLPPIHTSAPIPELTPRSPSSKRHRCPYCDTEFTRHHNLKSHLLTHSQEKPYVCQGCDMRFRRLHDLKRHSKLHTGEKPHICPRCDRKFARGDALARHSKGAGGCAGRRSSSGAFGSGGAGDSLDDSFEGNSSLVDMSHAGDDSVMSGVEYDGSTAAGIDAETEEERKRLSLPSIKTQNIRNKSAAASVGFHSLASHARSYPPLVQGQPQQQQTRSGSLYPPGSAGGRLPGPPSTTGSASATTATSGGSVHTPSTCTSSVPISASSVSLFSQHGIAESPKPMTPAVHDGKPYLGGFFSLCVYRLTDRPPFSARPTQQQRRYKQPLLVGAGHVDVHPDARGPA